MIDLNVTENATASGETDAPQPSVVVKNMRNPANRYLSLRYHLVHGMSEPQMTVLILSAQSELQQSFHVNYKMLTSIYVLSVK